MWIVFSRSLWLRNGLKKQAKQKKSCPDYRVYFLVESEMAVQSHSKILDCMVEVGCQRFEVQHLLGWKHRRGYIQSLTPLDKESYVTATV